MRALIVTALATVTACQPFYRDDLRAGRAAEDSSLINQELARAQEAAAAGDLPRAIELARSALRRNPERIGAYIDLAVYLYRAGAVAPSRAVMQHVATKFRSELRYHAQYAVVLAQDELVADAIDLSGVTDLAEASDIEGVTDALTELVQADTGWTPGTPTTPAPPPKAVAEAVGLYLRWLDGYGIADHPLLQAARARITKRVGDEIDARTPLGMRFVAIGPAAEAANARNDVSAALALYSQAFRVLPDDKFVVYRGGMARAAAQVSDPEAIDPAAVDFARTGDTAIQAGKLGTAIHAYRRAAAHAPWWREAHANLAELLTIAGRGTEAKLETEWVAGLTADTGWTQEHIDTARSDFDGDEVLDASDQCPYVPEDRDGIESDDGCPEPDNDHDGIQDVADTACPNAAEDRDGFEDNDGCPDPDNDNDRILDVADACPLQPETYNGTTDTDGCPDEGRLIVGATALELRAPIEFAGNTAKLARTAPAILDAVAGALATNPTIAIEVGVHGSFLPKPEANTALTQARADAILKYLVSHGVAPARATAVGYGDSKPLDPGTDAPALARNRRVELQIKK